MNSPTAAKTQINRNKRAVPTNSPTVQLTPEDRRGLINLQVMAVLNTIVTGNPWGGRTVVSKQDELQEFWSGLSPERRERLRAKWRKPRGRPKGSRGTPCNGDLLREYRRPRSRERFAEECGLSFSMIKRAEFDSPLQDWVFERIAATIRGLTGRSITAEDLKK